jgi:Ca-activated chloride channel homolog
MLRFDRFSLKVLLSLLVVLSIFATCPGMRAQNTDDDVHIKPRVVPKPDSASDVVKESGFTSHERPMKVSVDLVLVPVTITDPMNRLVTGLDKDNFAVFEGKNQQEIRSF